MLLADERAIVQILASLVSNAVNFTPRGGRATVFASMVEGRFALGVADTGDGMDEAGLKKALEPYGQTSLDKVTVEGRGTGLGLPIVRALIEAHCALFRIESTPGAGTKVWGEFATNRVRSVRVAA